MKHKYEFCSHFLFFFNHFWFYLGLGFVWEGPHPAVLRDCSRLCSQACSVKLQGLYMLLVTKPG